jgi:hypothetical protein
MYPFIYYVLFILRNKSCELIYNIFFLFQNNLILILALIIILITLFFIMISIKYPFWNRQPIFHTYDFWRKFYKKSFIINNEAITSKKYIDNDIKTFKYGELSNESFNEIVKFIQSNYIDSENIIYMALRKTFELYFTGQSDVTLITLYRDKGYSREINGCITSSSINMYFENKYMNAYYLDNICIHRGKTRNDLMKKMSISYKLFQTHENNQRKMNRFIKVSLFKKEINLCEGIIPLVKFETYLFHLKLPRNLRTPKKMICTRIYKTNYDILTDFIEKIKLNEICFKFNIHMDIGNIIGLLDSQEYYFYCLVIGKQKLGYYFFKNPRIIYEEFDGETLQLIGSYNNTKSVETFSIGYLIAINEIRKLRPFNMLILSNLSHNIMLLEKTLYNHHLVSQHMSAYYLYNYIIPKMPLAINDCLILL